MTKRKRQTRYLRGLYKTLKPLNIFVYKSMYAELLAIERKVMAYYFWNA